MSGVYNTCYYRLIIIFTLPIKPQSTTKLLKNNKVTNKVI